MVKGGIGRQRKTIKERKRGRRTNRKEMKTKKKEIRR
jgi:hypothetical protein